MKAAKRLGSEQNTFRFPNLVSELKRCLRKTPLIVETRVSNRKGVLRWVNSIPEKRKKTFREKSPNGAELRRGPFAPRPICAAADLRRGRFAPRKISARNFADQNAPKIFLVEKFF